MPDNLTASEVERINAAMRNAFPYFPETKWKRVPDFYRMCEMIAPHLPELLRAREESCPEYIDSLRSQLRRAEDMLIEAGIAVPRYGAPPSIKALISRAETAEHEREVIRRERDAARAEVADLKRQVQSRLCYPFSVETCDDPRCGCREEKADATKGIP